MSGLARAACALALACVIVLPCAAASTRSAVWEIVDIFPAQSRASIGQKEPVAAEPTADAPAGGDVAAQVAAAESPPAVASPPFEIVGEWREQGTHIFVLDGAGRTFILCDSACTIRGTIHPGEEIAEGYRLKSLSGTGVTIVAEDGRSLDLHGLELNS
ncbi:hypothetical protein ACOTFF_14055 [Achromobacter xylosoxidans]